MRGLSSRNSGSDSRVYRCSCGSWNYSGQPCLACAILIYQRRFVRVRGKNNDVHDNGTANQST